jgi:hypothetical protein
MTGIKDLDKLLEEMDPVLSSREYVFCTVSEAQFRRLKLDPLLVFREKEGVTLVVTKKIADTHSLSYSGVWALITLTVHSDLSAIGFLATITSRLAQHAISVNVVSAYHHDHLFVPSQKAESAIQVLNELSQSPR